MARKGVYLITGGNGEIAKTMVQEIAQHVRQGAIILVGRSQPTMDMQQWLNEFQDSELEVSYCMLDVTDLQAVEHCIVDIKAEYGDLSGIIHGAGVLMINSSSKNQKHRFPKCWPPLKYWVP